MSVQDLEKKLSLDNNWREKVICILISKGIFVDRDLFETKLKEFFLFLEIIGITAKEEADCRKHFVSWIIKNIKTNKNEQRVSTDKRRGSEVTITLPSDIEGPF